jgi:hypothetical protein
MPGLRPCSPWRNPAVLDLNDPADARIYIQAWVDLGDTVLGTIERPVTFQDDSDEEMLRVAKQLFMYCDQRQVFGTPKDPH